MRSGKSSAFWNFFGIFYILQVATTQKLQHFTVNGCVVICGVTAVLTELAVLVEITGGELVDTVVVVVVVTNTVPVLHLSVVQ